MIEVDMSETFYDTAPARTDDQSMTMISVRLATGDVDALRLSAQAKGVTVAHLVRASVQDLLARLRRDPEFVALVKSKRDELDRLVADLNEPVSDESTTSSTDVLPDTLRR